MTQDTTNQQSIPINELIPGMYVVAISYRKKNITIKSEGYILKQESVDKLIKAGIKSVIVDPTKQKKLESIDKVFSDVPPISENDIENTLENGNNEESAETPNAKNIKGYSAPDVTLYNKEPSVSIDQELLKANKLYDNAKSIQEKIIKSLRAHKTLNVKQLEENTNKMVDSIFRNQDALSCMSQLRDKDSYLVDHALNCSVLMSIFAKHLEIDANIIQELTLGAFLHDIGKVRIDDSVLNKPGELTEQEFDEVKTHVSHGLKILEDSPNISNIAMTLVREHHERLNGLGYPMHLIGDDISKYGRMMAIVDSYDAMTSDRPYKKGVFPIQAFKKLLRKCPDYYDEALVNEFIKCLGVYPVGTLVKLTSGKLGIISQLNSGKPLTPCVRVFYNTRLNQAIPIQEVDLSKAKHDDHIDCCIRPEDFNLNLLGFFKSAFIN